MPGQRFQWSRASIAAVAAPATDPRGALRFASPCALPPQVHVVRARPSAGEDVAGMIYALKVMRKDHVKSTHKLSTAKAERDVLAEAYDR